MKKKIHITPIAYVKNTRLHDEDDAWSSVSSVVVLNENIPLSALKGIEAFSHFEIIYLFHKALKIKSIGCATQEENYPIRLPAFLRKEKRKGQITSGFVRLT